MKAYKVFNPDWKCRDFQYEVGKTYKLLDESNNLLLPSMHIKGFHACEKLNRCFSYYDFNPLNKVAIVELSGEIISDDDKVVCNIITIIEELSWEIMLTLSNTGIGNSGHGNSGNKNSGNNNFGNINSGEWNSGNSNSGNSNSGNYNSGYKNSGDDNSGDSNLGDYNSGYKNSGDKNSGDRNSGDRNSGNKNSGNDNSGNRNSGHRNSGNMNIGNYNSGDWNSCNSETGHFNSISNSNSMINVFNVPTDMKLWIDSDKPNFIYHIVLNMWIDFANMSNDEKIANPNASTNGGYRKYFSYKEAWKNAFDNRNEDDLRLLKALPNFNAAVFEEISGINVNDSDSIKQQYQNDNRLDGPI